METVALVFYNASWTSVDIVTDLNAAFLPWPPAMLQWTKMDTGTDVAFYKQQMKIYQKLNGSDCT